MDTSQWPKNMHLGYAKNVIRRIDEEWTMEYPAPAKLLAEITPLKASVTKEDADYEQSRKADQTALIQQADYERDALLNQALTVIDAMAKVSAIPASQTAALQLKGQVDIYKPSAKLALRDESTTEKHFWPSTTTSPTASSRPTRRPRRPAASASPSPACLLSRPTTLTRTRSISSWRCLRSKGRPVGLKITQKSDSKSIKMIWLSPSGRRAKPSGRRPKIF